MIIKVIGVDSFGACIERDAEAIGLYGDASGLRALCRSIAAKYLTEWTHAYPVDNHGHNRR